MSLPFIWTSGDRSWEGEGYPEDGCQGKQERFLGDESACEGRECGNEDSVALWPG